MSALQEQILDAIKILADKSVDASGATLTLECEVVDIIDAGVGLYSVKYLGNTFDAYAPLSVNYKIGDIVFVIVPSGDMTATKIIIGSTAPSAGTYIDSESVDHYVEVSDNLFGTLANVELCTWHSQSYNLSLDTNNFETVFKDYLKNYRKYLFSARIKTDITIDQQVNGNYGLILNLPVIVDAGTGTGTLKTWKSISIDVNTIQGNPYRLDEFSLQNIYFELAEDTQYDASRNPYITVFVQDFMQNSSITAADIWIRDINFKVVEELTEEEKSGYSLTIVASDGNYFLAGKYATSKTLTPVLKVNGKTKKTDGYDCYWFVEDASITTTSDGYYPIGGLGWKCVNRKTNVNYNNDGTQTYQYVTNDYNIIVNAEDVASTLKYKCILTKDGIIIKNTLQLKNLNSNILFELVSATGSDSFVKDTGYVTLIARITGLDNSDLISTSWQRFDKDGNYLDNDFFTYVRKNDPVQRKDSTGVIKTWLETEIKYPCSILEQKNLVNCTFFRNTVKNGLAAQNNIGTASIFVTSSDDYSYKISIENGDVLYKYDADGDSPMIADYDGPASSKVKEIQPLHYRVFKADGSELSSTEYLYCRATWSVPKNSMIKLKTTYTSQDDNYYYIEGQGQIDINYTIIDTYNVKKLDNSILLNINFNENIISEVANIKFLKDGESGTNGSKYTGIITYGGYAYGELDSSSLPRKLQLIYINGRGWYYYDNATKKAKAWTAQTLGIKVYCDGAVLNSGYTTTWSIFDNGVTNPRASVSGGTITPSGTYTGEASSTIVEAKIVVGNAGNTNAQEVIYAYYPIEMTYFSNVNLTNGVVPNLDGGFDKVLYAADGTNPKYDNTNPFAYAANLVEDSGTDYYNFSWSVSSNLLISQQSGGSCQVKPVTKFDNGKSQNYIRVQMTIANAAMTRLNQRITELTAEKTAAQNKINYYFNIVQHLLDFSENFDYNNYKSMLVNSKNLLNYRSKLISYIEDLLIAITNIYDYCNNKNIDTNIFNYINIYNTIIAELNSQKSTLYAFGRTKNLSNLSTIVSKIVFQKATEYKAAYGVGSYEIFISYINSYNDLIDKYNNIISIITEKQSGSYIYQVPYTNWANYENAIIGLKDNTNLVWLVTNAGTEMTEIVALRQQLTSLSATLYSAPITHTYSAIVNMLDIIKKLIDNNTDELHRDIYIRKQTVAQGEWYNINTELTDLNSISTIGNNYIIHTKPIVMLYNRYELSSVNGWDGNKLYIDPNNDQYLLAPQVGAGAKQDGRFTGVVMGVKQFNTTNVQHIGLFGYHQGIQSYFMNAEDGSVIMGKSGTGQIIADPKSGKALLYSSAFWTNYGNDGKPSSYSSSNESGSGMLIDLTTPAIRFGNGNFSVNSSGHLTAKGGGSIAGWSISDTILTGGQTTLNSNGTITCSNLIANTSGSIGGWTINPTTLTGGNTTLNSDGTITCRNLIANTSGSIGGWTIGSSTLTGGNTTLNSNGTITCCNLVANVDGQIGGWNIESDGLNADGIYISSDGGIYCDDWEINSDGSAYFRNVTITSSNYSSGKVSILNWGENFYVDRYGNLTCANAYIKGKIETHEGKIGSWKIGTDGLYYQGVGDWDPKVTPERSQLRNVYAVNGLHAVVDSGGGILDYDIVNHIDRLWDGKVAHGTYSGTCTVGGKTGTCSITI